MCTCSLHVHVCSNNPLLHCTNPHTCTMQTYMHVLYAWYGLRLWWSSWISCSLILSRFSRKLLNSAREVAEQEPSDRYCKRLSNHNKYSTAIKNNETKKLIATINFLKNLPFTLIYHCVQGYNILCTVGVHIL